jgi:hypothetical protein
MCALHTARHTQLTCDICHLSHWSVSEPCLWWLRVVITTRLITGYLTILTLVLPTTKGIHVQKIAKRILMGQSTCIYEIKQCGFNTAHRECLSVLQCKIHITLCVYFATVCAYTFCLWSDPLLIK